MSLRISKNLQPDEKNNKLKWTLIEKIKQNKIIFYKDYIETIRKSWKGISRTLGWNNALLWWYTLSTSSLSFDRAATPRLLRGFWQCINTWFDYKTQDITWNLFDRYKFYLSLDLSTEEKKHKAVSMYQEIIDKAKEKKLSLQIKTEDHKYDSANLYTFNFTQLREIIQEMYAKYQSYWIFLSCEHPMQWKIDWVNETHIWYVQEPIGWLWWSHSGRMEKLWKYIEEWKTYEEACWLIWVKPETPYLIDTETDIYKTAFQKEKTRQEKQKKWIIDGLKSKLE